VQNASLLELGLRLALSLGVVLMLMFGAAWFLRRRQAGGRSPLRFGGGARTQRVEMLARQTVGRNASVAVVRVGERALVLGVTEHSVTVLTEGEAHAFDPPEPVVVGPVSRFSGMGSKAQRTALSGSPDGSGPTRKSFIEALREMTIRR
jgi:flagellar protein FliO/FliZ